MLVPPTSSPQRRYRCRFYGAVLPAWLPVAKRPNGALLLGHLSRDHPDQVGIYLDQMCGSEDIGELAAHAFEIIEDPASSLSGATIAVSPGG